MAATSAPKRHPDAPVDQGRNGEGEGYRKAHVADIEQRRMDGHANVLQQGIQVTAVDRRRQQAFEGV
jgi:hypothetical protein